MKKHTLRLGFVMTILAAPLALSGCIVVAAAAGAGTYAYVSGALDATLDSSLDRAVAATERGLKDLRFSAVLVTHDALVGKATATMADDTDIEIKLKKITDTTTRVSIRVGTFGSEKKSIEILDAIKKRL